MENDANKTNMIIVIALAIVVVLVSVIAIIYNILVKNDDKNIIKDDYQINEETNVKTVYSSYKIGEKVELSDSSSWHVIEDTSINNGYVVLLKDTKLENEIDLNQVNDYIEYNYKEQLVNTLKCEKEDIEVSRLLTSEDIKRITGMDIELDTKFNDNYNYLGNEDTLIDMKNNDNYVVIEDNTLKELKEKNSYTVRPVIKISKNYIN